jgi:hypothetical protein
MYTPKHSSFINYYFPILFYYMEGCIVASTDLGMIATSLGAVTLIIGFLYSVYKIAKRIDQSIGTDSQGRTLSERINRVEHQLWENGGESLADRVNNIEKCTQETNAQMVIIKDILLQIVGAQVQPQAKPRTARKKSASKKV